MAVPSVSIALTTYDRPALLARALFSIRRQTFADWELILVADGPPSPSTLRVIERFARHDARIRPVRFHTNANNPALRVNQALAIARAPLFAFQDDDDLWFPNALADLVDGHRTHPEAGLVYGTVNFMDARTGCCFDPGFGEDFDREALRRRNLLCNNAALVKREAIDAVGAYDESSILRAFFDWDLWLRIAERYAVQKVDRVLGEVWAFQPDSVGRRAAIDYLRIDARIRGRRPLPLEGRLGPPRTVVFLTHGHHPSIANWRVHFLVHAVNRAGTPWRARHADVSTPGWESCLDVADVLVLYRFHRRLPGLFGRPRPGSKVVIDLDDAVFEEAIPEHIRRADAVTVSTRRLRETIGRANVFVRANGVPREVIAAVDALPPPDGRFVVGWLAGLNPNDDEEMVVAIARGLARRRPGIGFYYLGKSAELHRALRAIDGLTLTRDDYIETDDLTVYYRRLREVGVQCIIAPMVDDALNRAKSVVKFIDSGVLRIPLVVSRVGAYCETIRSGENGMLADSPGAFVDAVIGLAQDPGRARAMAESARRDVEAYHTMDRVVDRFLIDLETIHGREGVTAAGGRLPPSPPSLSILIVNWNTEFLLFHCLQSLREHPPAEGCEVIVVDNASADDSAEMTARRFEEVTLIRNNDNRGYAAANNQALGLARGEWVLLLNPDTEVTPGALDSLLAFARRTPGIGAVTPRLEYPDGRTQPSCMRLPTRFTALVHDTILSRIPPGRGHHARYLMRDFDHAEPRVVEQAPGACLFAPRELLLDLGGMDESLFLYFNDVDLCRRIRARGRSIHFRPEAVVRHHEGAAVRHYPDQASEWHVNRIRYYRKHHGRVGAWLCKGALVYVGVRELLRTLVRPRIAWRDRRGLLVSITRALRRGLEA